MEQLSHPQASLKHGLRVPEHSFGWYSPPETASGAHLEALNWALGIKGSLAQIFDPMTVSKASDKDTQENSKYRASARL
jgi:hypothetical protein